MGVESGIVRTHVLILEVLYGVLYPEAQVIDFFKKTKGTLENERTVDINPWTNNTREQKDSSAGVSPFDALVQVPRKIAFVCLRLARSLNLVMAC